MACASRVAGSTGTNASKKPLSEPPRPRLQQTCDAGNPFKRSLVRAHDRRADAGSRSRGTACRPNRYDCLRSRLVRSDVEQLVPAAVARDRAQHVEVQEVRAFDFAEAIDVPADARVGDPDGLGLATSCGRAVSHYTTVREADPTAARCASETSMCSLFRLVRLRFEMPLCECSPGARFQVSLETDRPRHIRELNDDVEAPGPARGGVLTAPRVVVSEPRVYVGCEADVEVRV